MTTEEKAKAYDKALEKARLLCAYPTTKPFISDLQDLFPELAEPDDERIRKEIINYFEHYPNIIVKRERKNDYIAWLEKQVQKPQGKSALEVAKEEKVDNQNCVKQPTDEEMKELLQTEYEKGRADTLAEMKKSWNEEDEKFFNTALWHISYSISNGKSTDFHCDTTEWFKSLKERVQPQSQWKPSEEQMIAISTAINVLGKGTLNGKYLIELHEQLKKLKE